MDYEPIAVSYLVVSEDKDAANLQGVALPFQYEVKML